MLSAVIPAAAFSTIMLPSAKTIIVGALLGFLVNAVIFIQNLSKYSLPHKTLFWIFALHPDHLQSCWPQLQQALLRLLGHEDWKHVMRCMKSAAGMCVASPTCSYVKLVCAQVDIGGSERWNNGRVSVVIVAPSCDHVSEFGQFAFQPLWLTAIFSQWYNRWPGSFPGQPPDPLVHWTTCQSCPSPHLPLPNFSLPDWAVCNSTPICFV